MLYAQINFNTFLFLLGLMGIVSNRKNIIIILMCIELVLLSQNLNFVTFSVYLDDIIGQIFCLFVLTVAAGESSIGLALLILYYRVRGSISGIEPSTLKG